MSYPKAAGTARGRQVAARQQGRRRGHVPLLAVLVQSLSLLEGFNVDLVLRPVPGLLRPDQIRSGYEWDFEVIQGNL